MMTGRKQFKSILSPIAYSLICLFTVLFVLLPLGSTTTYAAAGDQKIFDSYGLFTDKEISKLKDISKEYGEAGKVDIVIITTDELDGKTREQYLEDFYDANGFGYNKEFGDAVLILINMSSNDRGVEILGFGEAEKYISGSRKDRILDDIVPMLSGGKYYNAMAEYSKQVAYYMNQKGIFFNIFFQLAIALVIGGVAVIIMALQSGGKITVSNRTYLDEQHSKLIASQDNYIRTTTTRVRKPTNNSSGGGGVSSGGHSHSGGGRSF